MNRVRGINIVWLSLIAVLLGAMTVNIGASAGNTKLYIDPSTIPGPGQDGSIGESYVIGVYVDQVTDLWGVGFKIQIAPYASVLTISEIFEGPFLATGWDPSPNLPTDFSYTIDLFKGYVYVAIVRLPNPDPEVPRMGASGSGLIATFKLTVIEAGQCPVDITEDYMLDSNGFPILHQASGGNYFGPMCSLTRVEVLPGRKVYVGETMTFNTKVKNEGKVPMNVRVRYDIARVEDGRHIKLYTGQRYLGSGLGEDPRHVYLYVNGYTGSYNGYGWTNVGNAPYLDAIDANITAGTGNYMWADEDGSINGQFDFETYTLGPQDIVDKVILEAYTYGPSHNDGNPALHLDLDTYARAPGGAAPTTWIGSLWTAPSWAWRSPLHETRTLSDFWPTLKTQAGLDLARIRYVYYWSESGVSHGPAYIDAMRLRVDFAGVDPVEPPVFVIMPGQQLDLTVVTWTAKTEHIGTYDATATIEYTLEGLKWNSWASKQKTFSFSIVP